VRLEPHELTQYRSQGYVVKKGVFSPKDLQPLKDALCDLVDQGARRSFEEGKIEDIYRDDGFERRLARIHAESEEAAQEVMGLITGRGGGGFSGGEMLDLLRNEALVDCVADLVGPDIVGAAAYRIRPKLPGHVRTEVSWHQDSGYFLPHCDRFMIVTCWIPLVDATVENGCLHVIPGLHEEGVFRHYTGGHGGYLEIPMDEMPASKPLPVEMNQGDVLLLTNLTPHASFENLSDIVRWSIDLRYQPLHAPNNVEDDPSTYIPEREQVTMACYPSEADFVIRDSRHPEREVRTQKAFSTLRERYNQARPYNPGRGWTRLKDRT